MCSTVEWYIPNRVIYVRWSQTITLDEIHDINAQIIELLDQGDVPVHIVGDSSQVEHLQFLSHHFRRHKNFVEHPMLGWTIHIASNPNMSMLGNILPQKPARNHYRAFTKLNHAVRFLKSYDMTLDWNAANSIAQAV